MGNAREQSTAGDGEDASFDALLKRAAHASGPALSRLSRRLHPGSSLADGRLRITRRIGEGGVGVVYEAHDEQRRATVALKTLNRIGSDSVYRIKNEFRSLADVSHPSLCRLHELFGDGDDWFFTMELVDGERFEEWVRPENAFDEARVRVAFAQLRDAIAAIHAAGKLHRDLKPSNVLVTPSGRVVVLDFGLAVDCHIGGVGQTLLDQSVSGTPAYMAPEQAAGAAATAASDFYAVGVMLFEALTGRLPFEGRVGEILAAKQRDPAPPVNALFRDAPQDLALLCDALLESVPAKRPDAAALRERLGPASYVSAPLLERKTLAPPRELLVGRQVELAELQAAYDAMRERHPVVMFVAGESGMGKSALVTHFLDGVRAQAHAAVLAGRCYERESVPFKAFDAVLDDLSRYLRKLTRQEAGDLMPREVFALARLFPVLERCDAVAQAPKKEIPDLQELQYRAFAAFTELLGRIRDRRPLVVYIDDLQWTDRDSTVLMDYLLAQPDPTPLLLIASHRSEGAGDNALLQQTLRSARKNRKLDCRVLAVEQLSPEATQLLAQRMLGDGAPAAAAAAIGREAQGSPFFVGELVRQACVAGAGTTQLTLQQAVVRHVEMLGERPRALLDVLAIAGRPLSVQYALDAARVDHDAVDRLVAENLVRVASAGGGTRTLECYHDKIREGVADACAPQTLADVHHRLAQTLARDPSADPEHLALHLHGAGDTDRAAACYEQAGDLSAGGPLAFEHAARQYEQALLLGNHGEEKARSLRVKLGAALAAAGRSREAAQAFRAASIGAPAEQALEYTRTAAHYLMTSGHVDEGRALLGEVLNAIGLALPSSSRTALLSALWSRTRLSLRGLRLRAASSSEIPREAEAQLAALWTVAQGSAGNDPFLMVETSARYARLALDEGSRPHAARGLAMEAYIVSFDGAQTRTRNEGLLSHASQLAASVAVPEILGWVQEIQGAVLVHEGRFAEARGALEQALAFLQQRCTAVPFELAGTRVYHQLARWHLGEFADLSLTTPALVDDALRRGDLYQGTLLGTGVSIPAWLANRGFEDAKARHEEAKRRFQRQSCYLWGDFVILLAEMYLALYAGQACKGLLAAAEQWPAVQSSQLLRMHLARSLMLFARGGCALASVRQGGSSTRADLVLTRAHIGQLHRTHVPHARGLAAILEAGLALHERKPERAAERLKAAIASFDLGALRMHAAAARRRLGQLLGGDEGKAFLSVGDAAMLAQATSDLESTTEMLTPGCRS